MKLPAPPLWKTLVVAVLIVALGFGLGFELGPLSAQNTGYRFGPNGIIFAGTQGGVCFESSINAGPDSCLFRMNTGQIGAALQTVNTGWAQIPAPPVVALAASGSGATIPTGTFRGALTYMTINGGETNVPAAEEATQSVTLGQNIVYTAPIAAAGAAGYRIYGSEGAAGTPLLQAINTTVCTGAFQVNGPQGAGTGPFVCPFGANATITSAVLTSSGNVIPNIPGNPALISSGIPEPAANTAAYPAMIPELIANLVQVPTLSTITTAQTFATIPLIAGVQNSIGKVLHIVGHGRYTSASQTGTMTIAVTEGGITPLTITSAAIVTGGQTNQQFNFDYKITTNATGSAGTLWGHGQLCPNLATGTQTTTGLVCSADTNTAVSSAINLTAQNNLAVTIAMSSSTTSATLDDMQVYLEN